MFVFLGSLGITIYSYNENHVQIMCHDVYKQVPIILAYM